MNHYTRSIVTTLILSFVAGFADANTFIAADHIFSAHVTGNFIVFAYSVLNGFSFNEWLKLMSFPVFIISVMIAEKIFSEVHNKYVLLLLEGVILVVTGIVYIFLMSNQNQYNPYLALIVVFAISMQNAYGKMFGKDTFGLTTVMTGNSTSVGLELAKAFRTKFKYKENLIELKNQSFAILAFLVGCLFGSICGQKYSMGAILIPGCAMLVFSACVYNQGKVKPIN